MSFSATLRELQTLSGQQWLDRATQTLPRALTVVLVVAIAWQLVQLTWLLLDRGSPDDSSDMVMAPPPPTATRKGIDVQAIASAHIFGTAQDEPVAAADAKETQMNLVLAGVFAASDPTKGLAMIGESPQSSKVYAVGAVVRPGTKLHSVYLDRVILDRNGQLETLSLPRPSTAGIITRSAAAPRPANNGQFADNLRRIAETNPTAFAEVVRPQPVFANGVQRGYRVYPGRNRQQFAKLGLQPGDLVLSINGTPLDDPQRGMEIFNTIGTSDRVSVTVERNGQSQELTLNTAQIMLPDSSNPPPGRTVQPRPIQTPNFTPEPE
ncbi:MAG TPA: type II secretion system protein GspC [Steroidobacteraceae bacterium]|jgi:general secretion pathway protein C|nr:type II secretion system protein GspC [Steroidobacteraceae bacterium]